METSKDGKPKKTFPATTLDEVAGMLQGRVTPKSDEEIEQAMEKAGMRHREDEDQK
jgi:hypothetical protein